MKIINRAKILLKKINTHIKNNDGIYILVPSLLFIIVLGIGYVSVNKYLEVKHNPTSIDSIRKQIDSIQVDIDSTTKYRERLLTKNDTNKIEIKTIERKYETIKNNIIKQRPDSDYLFFTSYTNQYWKQYRRDNDSTIKN